MNPRTTIASTDTAGHYEINLGLGTVEPAPDGVGFIATVGKVTATSINPASAARSAVLRAMSGGAEQTADFGFAR